MVYYSEKYSILFKKSYYEIYFAGYRMLFLDEK